MVDRYSVQSFPYAGNIIDHEGMWVTYYDYEALEAKLNRLVEAAKVGIKRNHIITDAEDFKQHLQGTWVAIPEQNFDHIKAAIEAVEGGGR